MRSIPIAPGIHLSPIEQSTLADEVVSRVHDAIIIGQLRPGERLVETALARQLGVSRSPVREALLRLGSLGLVTRTDQGTHVWDPTDADVEEVFTLRTMLESMAAEWAIANLSEEDFDHLRGLIAEELEAVEANDLVATIAVDREFHGYVCDKSGHARLTRWWNELMGQWQVLLYSFFKNSPPGTPYDAVEDHKTIVDALQRGDLSRVVELHHATNERVCNQVKHIFTGC